MSEIPPPLEESEAAAKGPMKPLFPLLTVMVLTAILIYAYVLRSEWSSSVTPTDNPRSGELRLVDPNPKAGVADFRNFAWSYRLPIGGHYELRITDLASGQVVVDSHRTELPEFEPNVEEQTALGDEIEVWIGAFDTDGTTLLSETTRTLKLDEDS